MTDTPVPWYRFRKTSNLTKYDLPAPERARTTELWLSCAHLFQIRTPLLVVLTPYSSPSGAATVPGAGAARSAEARGNAAARAVVSRMRRIRSGSTPTGRVEIQPWWCRNVAGCTSSSTLAAADFTPAVTVRSSSRVRAWMVT